jgi:hypothetical protein
MISNSGKSDTVVVGTAYPGLGKFLENYLDSLEDQSCSDFDLLIVNDGLDGLDGLLAVRKLSWRTVNVDGSVSCNRRTLICNALEMGYHKIIFADCDDTFAADRVEVVSSMLDKDSIIVNDIDIVDATDREEVSRYFSRRFGEDEMITIHALRVGNMMGLTNCAVRADVFDSCPALVSGDLVAFDWYLWSSVLLGGCEARFTSKTSSKYRVYLGNTAGLPQVLNEKNIVKGVDVKCQYYELMSALDDSYAKLASEFRQVNNKLSDQGWLKDYMVALEEREIENHIWWENIRAPSEVGFK